jgi:hypothetical protein
MISTLYARIVLLITTALVITTTQAQKISKYSKWEIGGGLSAFIYQGDLTPRRLGSIETTKPGILLYANYKLKEQLILQAAFAWGKLKGDDSKYNNPAYRRERNFLFTTPVKEVSIKANYSFFKKYKGDEALLFPYVGAGVGVAFFNIIKDYSRLTEKLSIAEPRIVQGLVMDNSSTPTKVLITIPLTVGVRKMYNERLDLFAEINYRYITTDYLDGFSKAANSNSKDKFYSINAGVVYKFYKNNAIGCPTY